MAIYSENFVSVRKLYPRMTERVQSRMAVADPADATERDYRDLLSEANLNYFHREYSIALDNYKSVRYKILVQSHPEMPKSPGLHTILDIDYKAIDPKRLMEFSRRLYTRPNPGDPIEMQLTDTRLFQASEVTANPVFQKFSAIGLDSKILSTTDINGLLGAARDLVVTGAVDQAVKVYQQAATQAADSGQLKLAAQTIEESIAMRTAYTKGQQRPVVLRTALEDISTAEKIYTQLNDSVALGVMKANRANITSELGTTGPSTPTHLGPVATAILPLAGGGSIPLSALLTDVAPINIPVSAARQTLSVNLPDLQTTKPVMISSPAGWQTAPQLIVSHATAAVPRQAGLFSPAGTTTLALDAAGYQANVMSAIYTPRISATTLEGINFYEQVEVNFVSYFVHLYFFVLPIAIGDCYLAMGRYPNAISEYQSVLAYPFLNLGIEAPYVWLKLANAHLKWAETLFRRGLAADAKTKYEQIITTAGVVPIGLPLYAPAQFSSLRTAAAEVAKEIKNLPHAAVNPKVAEAVIAAYTKLQYIAQGFNFLGLPPDYAPIFRFKYLQNAATYLADNAAEAERSFITFRSTAENQKLEHMQLQNAADVNQVALQIEQKRMDDAAREVEAATETREYAELRKDHADQSVTDWDTDGRDLTSMNAALAWASNAANDQDITYTNVHYDGSRHDYAGTVEDFFDTVGEKREWLNWEMQRDKLVRQQAEATAEVGIAQTREAQAIVRQQIQALNVTLAQKRLEGSQQVLEYSQDRMFDEDMWFQLANQLQDLAGYYLDVAIYAAFVMERAYELEFDRSLNRIRLDYGVGTGASTLLGGELLKRDIQSFTVDYLEHAQKKNPVRMLFSLREEFPAEYATFLTTGILPFRTYLEVFDRRFPGSYRRKIKKLEIFVEGLVPLEGAVGKLTNQGINSEWRLVGGNWVPLTRVMPVERMLLSSYEFRRDITVFAPSDEILGLFENMGPQCNWTIEIPRSSNNLDYDAISDIKFAMYFDADYSDSLATHTKALYLNTGGRSTVLSGRFQFPDEYFRLDADRKVTFSLNQSFFAYNFSDLNLSAFGVRLLPKTGGPLAGVAVKVTRTSDNSTITGNTDADGVLQGAVATMAPFNAWKGVSPLDEFTVQLDAPTDTTNISDVQLFFSYTFTYRADGTL